MTVLDAKPREANKLIGEQVRKARSIANFSQRKLATIIGVNQDTVSKWESGIYAINAQRLAQVAAATGQPIRFFYGEPGTTEPQLGQLGFKQWRRGASRHTQELGLLVS